VQLVEDVKKFGAEVVIFSSMHESGEREFGLPLLSTTAIDDYIVAELNQLTGIAAILTYPLDVEVVQDEEKLLTARRDGTTDANMEAL
jgi:protein pelota